MSNIWKKILLAENEVLKQAKYPIDKLIIDRTTHNNLMNELNILSTEDISHVLCHSGTYPVEILETMSHAVYFKLAKS